ncbi:hypothetical protein A9995_07575 [Erythrobacter sp. QSSC1-22B]|uniref:DUF1993 domain-containing protein n=1 Tax=Erythrobacter sp. QSSC1-22B TaxID=1860125 RepID=UPI000804C3B3|nr:DUF1993 domain-containing protein [Erythrobacter sp. QSSC1-22B]OBX19593.1 hypothetical protein A9995_07575 [Erythrobacter sp. QSSC1-22B]
MPLSLHAAFIPSALQIIDSTRGLVDRGESWCSEQEHDPAHVLSARIYEDMLPFTYQVASVAGHTAGALAGLTNGVFQPDLSPPPESFDGLRDKLAGARDALEQVSEDDLEQAIGRDMRFEFRAYKLEFTADEFLLSFSQPNFYFHAATAYDILRMLGVPIGKRDFNGRMRLKQG